MSVDGNVTPYLALNISKYWVCILEISCDAQDIAVEYATALAQSALDRTSTGRGGKLQAEDVLFVVRKVSGPALPAQCHDSQNVKAKMKVAGLKRGIRKLQNLTHGILRVLAAWRQSGRALWMSTPQQALGSPPLMPC